MLRVRVRSVLVATAIVLAMAASAFAEAVPVEPGAASAAQFGSYTECGCHAALIEQWAPSMHAQALTDPLYLTKLEEAEKATGGKLGAFCNKCHGPIATMARAFEAGPLEGVSAEGVTCSFCHQAVGLAGKPANTAHLVETDGVRRAQLKDPQAPHPAAYSEFHTSAEICGGCHNVDHPINGVHLEATYTEWLESPYAAEGIVCQDCHMSVEPGTIGPTRGQAAAGGPERDNIYKMTFVGGQVALGPAEVATARLKSAATIALEIDDILAPGEETSLTVTITNSGAGHYLPTGLTEVRQMWLEVVAEGPDGEPAKVGERRFGTILRDDKGNAPVELWEAVAIESDDRIPPRESVTESYAFTMPQGVDRATVKASLLYKSAPDEFAEKAGVDNPTTEMAVAVQEVFTTEDAKAAALQTQTAGTESWNIIVLVVGLAAIFGLVAFFLFKARAKRA
jgi:hypothetical protein